MQDETNIISLDLQIIPDEDLMILQQKVASQLRDREKLRAKVKKECLNSAEVSSIKEEIDALQREFNALPKCGIKLNKTVTIKLKLACLAEQVSVTTLLSDCYYDDNEEYMYVEFYADDISDLPYSCRESFKSSIEELSLYPDSIIDFCQGTDITPFTQLQDKLHNISAKIHKLGISVRDIMKYGK